MTSSRMPKDCPVSGFRGYCSDRCLFNHDYSCSPCAMRFRSDTDYTTHIKSRSHYKTIHAKQTHHQNRTTSVPRARRPYKERIYKRNRRNGMGGVDRQYPHDPERNRGMENRSLPLTLAQSNHWKTFCDMCGVHVNIPISTETRHQIYDSSCNDNTSTSVNPKYEDSEEWRKHVNGWGHKSKVRMEEQQKALEPAQQNKFGVEVEGWCGGLDFGIVSKEVASTGYDRQLRIIVRKRIGVRFRDAKVEDEGSPFTAMRLGDLMLTPNGTSRVQVTLNASDEGKYYSRLVLQFSSRAGEVFEIVRPLQAIIAAQVPQKTPATTAGFRTRGRHIPKHILQDNTVWRPQKGPVPYKLKLPTAYIPEYIKARLRGPNSEVVEGMEAAERCEVTLESHRLKLKESLWAEEYTLNKVITGNDIKEAQIEERNGSYVLGLPNLAERRPSILRGDVVHIVIHGGEQWHKGRVASVEQNQILLTFGQRFNEIYRSGMPYDVSFALNRFSLRRQHQALECPFQRADVLFPQSSSEHYIISTDAATKSSKFTNTEILNNEDQARAVTLIAQRPPGSIPFILFGPPGTGKSATIAEAINQILDVSPDAHILVCAPSNPAVDQLARKIDCSKSELFRYYAPVHPAKDIPEDFLEYTYIYKDTPGCDRAEVMEDYRVIVTTCSSASVFFNIGMKTGHFTHIFIDEAGQATEPEALMPIQTMADENTNIFLAGDPKQLGPVVYSSVARNCGLGTSYLERLMGMEAYQNIEDNDDIVQLTTSYRSHPAILKFPADKFYGGRLQSAADDDITDSLLDSDYMARVGGDSQFPVVFHPVYGKDEQEPSCPSFFNTCEVNRVMETIHSLLQEIEGHEIGVIAPYRAQCIKIRQALKQKQNGNTIRVGSVEEFQGQERRVIIISTVRSTEDFRQFDQRHGLGFIADDKRFNVAITRARALLIVIGNPDVLGANSTWRSFLNYIHNNGGWIGPEPRWDTQAPVDDNARYDYELHQAAAAENFQEWEDIPSVSDSDTDIPTPTGSREELPNSEFPVVCEDVADIDDEHEHRLDTKMGVEDEVRQRATELQHVDRGCEIEIDA